MSSKKGGYRDWLVATLVKYAEAPWLPLVLLVVASANSLTGGMFIWLFGVTQGMLYAVIVLAHRRWGILIGPCTLATGSAITAFTYMTLLKQGGAELLLEKTGARDNAWFLTAHSYAEEYGATGLFFLQIAPIPVPSAVIVTCGVLADVEEWKIYFLVVFSRLLQLCVGAYFMRMTLLTEGKTLEVALREHFGLQSTETENPGKSKKGKSAKSE